MRGGGPGEEISLSHTAAQPAQEVQLLGLFDAFSDHGQGKLVGQSEDAFQHRHGWHDRGLTGDKGAVDLEDVDGKASQRAEGREASTEVIDGDADTETLQRVQ